jgi:hypothetical protein
VTVRVVAGVDIGNSTTEVVLARLPGPETLGHGRVPTRGGKGSPASLDGAAALVRRLAGEHHVAVTAAAVTPLRPVRTTAAVLPEPAPDTGRLRVVLAGTPTAAGHGLGVGRPHLLAESSAEDSAGSGRVAAGGPVVAVVPAGMGYRAALPRLRALLAAGRLAAVVLADDEAVLVGNRLGATVPVVDEVPARQVLGADLVAVEVAPAGTPVRLLADPLRLAAAFGLDGGERAHAARLVARVADSSNAVVALDARPAPPVPTEAAGWIDLRGPSGVRERTPFLAGHAALAAGPVGLAVGYAVPAGDGHAEYRVEDLWTVDLAEVAETVVARAGSVRSRAVALAALDSDAPYRDPADGLAARLDLPVHTVGTEPAAARRGGLTTPGAEPGAVLVDVGGGTVDVVTAGGAVVAAGGGELLTVATAALTGTSRAAAEWVKRGPARRVEAPQVLLGEDGSRSFLDQPAPADTVGALVAPGPAGLLPFDRVHGPGEWRALRLRLKAAVLGGNVARALRTRGEEPGTVVVVGGAAGDEEVLGAVVRALPAGTAVGRGDVAGALGHRYAVAYGLVLALAEDA